MKLSEMIAKLEELKDVHGDVNIFTEVVSNYGEDYDDEEPILRFIEKAEYSDLERFVRIT